MTVLLWKILQYYIILVFEYSSTCFNLVVSTQYCSTVSTTVVNEWHTGTGTGIPVHKILQVFKYIHIQMHNTVTVSSYSTTVQLSLIVVDYYYSEYLYWHYQYSNTITLL